MIDTTIFIISLLIVMALGAVVVWLVRKNVDNLNKQLKEGNQELRDKLQAADGKAQMLADENVNLKTQHADRKSVV